MSQIIWVFVWLVTAYLVGQVAYAKGRKDKWDELSKEYICFHKSVIVCREKKEEKTKKHIDNRSKKKYNKKSYSNSK